MPAAVLHLPAPTARPRGATPDAELARAAGRGDVAAFEALYERHHLGLLSFCRHMLGRPHDAEDVVQHTFLAADRTFRSGRVPKAVRAWLYTVARNRCVSLLRARRDDQALPDAAMPATESLAAEVERREELRHLLADLRTLPDDQRAALLLSELGDLSHAEVADVLGVRTAKVKALVFQARKTLLAVSDARAIPCPSIRDELAGAYGSAQRRRHLRDHLERCEGCRAFHAAVRRQRSAVAAILPVAPSVALRDGILAGLGVGTAGATAAGGAGFGALAASCAPSRRSAAPRPAAAAPASARSCSPSPCSAGPRPAVGAVAVTQGSIRPRSEPGGGPLGRSARPARRRPPFGSPRPARPPRAPPAEPGLPRLRPARVPGEAGARPAGARRGDARTRASAPAARERARGKPAAPHRPRPRPRRAAGARRSRRRQRRRQARAGLEAAGAAEGSRTARGEARPGAAGGSRPGAQGRSRAGRVAARSGQGAEGAARPGQGEVIA